MPEVLPTALRLRQPSLLLKCAVVLAISAGAAFAAPPPKTPSVRSLQLNLPAQSRVPYKASGLKGEVTLDPKLLLQLVLAHSAEIKFSKVQIDIATELSAAEAALYEATFFTALHKDGGPRQRTVEERIASTSTANVTVLHENVKSIESGIKDRLPSGGDVSLSYLLRERRNNLIATAAPSDTEYNGSVVLSVKQPLLKGFGRSVVETDLRVSRAEKEISVLQYQQQIMKTCNDALGVYWQLYRALEVRRIREQALDYARQVSNDTTARIDAGKLPGSNLIEAKAAVLLREVEKIRADQGVREAQIRLQTLLNISSLEESGLTLVVREGGADLSHVKLGSAEERYRRSLETWPALQIAKLRGEQAGMRLAFARNQTLPTMDLLLSRTYTGLASDNQDARQLATHNKYAEWSVGINIEIPLEGNQKARSQYRAQLARVAQAQIELDSIYNSLANDIRAKLDAATAGREEVERSTEDVEVRGRILSIEKYRYDSGLGLLAQLLQREAELSESRQRLVESNARLGQANDALLFADGSLLREYGITVKE